MTEHARVPSSPDDAADKPVFAPYAAPAGGWGALHATARALREQSVDLKGSRALLSMNQPEGFDCPGCAWPDPRHTSSFEFCENGAKAVTWELTKRRVTREFFAAHTVDQLEQESDYWLEEQGRLTEPMRYDPATDHYVPVGWDEAFALVGRELNALGDPSEAEFYTSGRTSNEAAFMYQLFARRFGTNNFPDCSNMCHEPTSVGLPESIGIGKGTVLLEDFAQADAIFIIGQNPGTNSPRMLTELHRASRRHVPIVVFNPLRERALERFAAPQDAVEMATLMGQPFTGLNGGPQFQFNEAISLQIPVETQAEADRFADALSAVPEAEQCGWVKDRFGVSWQIVPRQLIGLIAAIERAADGIARSA